MKKYLLLCIISVALFAQGEFILDTSVVYIPASLMQSSPSMVYNGTNWFVVWQDQWIGNIYGARITESGQLMDPITIRIVWNLLGTSDNRSPSVAFSGTNYLVVWEDYHSYNSHIKGARVMQDGTVIDSTPINISISPEPPLPSEWKWAPVISFDGTNYLVVWADYTQGYYYINCARVTPTGAVLDPYGIAISSDSPDKNFPAVAFDGANYLTVWQDKRNGNFDIYGARITPSGTVLDPSGIPINLNPGAQTQPSISFDGTNYFIVWQDSSANNFNIVGTRITPMGGVLDTTGIVISSENSPLVSPEVKFDGINYLVCWRKAWPNGNIYGARVAPNGTVLDSAILIYEDGYLSSSRLGLAFGDSTYLVAWEGLNNLETSNNCDIYGVRVTRNVNVIDSLKHCLSTTIKSTEVYPSLSFDGVNYLAVWEDRTYPVPPVDNSGFTIQASRIAPDGSILDPEGIIVTKRNGHSPSVIYGAPYYFTAWVRAYPDWKIYCARLTTQGTVLDTAGIFISSSCYYKPSVGFDGTNYLVTWHTGDIYAKRVNQDGIVLDPNPIVISNAFLDQEFPSVAFDGFNYFIVWQDDRNAGATSLDIYGARLTPDGIVLDTNGVPISTAPFVQRNPAVAFGDTNYLVVWRDRRNSIDYDIYGARVNTAGTVLDPNGIAICTASGNQEMPAATFDGNDYIVVWHDSSNSNIYGARVSRTGEVVNTFIVSAQPGDQNNPSLVHGMNDSILIAYSGWVDSISGKTVNTYRIWGKFYPFTSVEETPRYSTREAGYLKVYPNPFRNVVCIKFQIPNKSEISLNIYDATGRLVRCLTLDAQRLTPVVWDGTDDSGRRLPVGVYFCQVQCGDKRVIKKVIMVQ